MTYKGYLIDLDGTIYLGEKPIVEGKRFIERLQTSDIPFLFLTNNTTKKIEKVQKKLQDKFDIHVKKESIYTASLATIDYMNSKPFGKKVFIIGEAGLKEPILEAGYTWDEVTPDFVVVGLDSKATYRDFEIATLAIQKGAHFIGTNPDKNIPTERGLVPGAGSLISLVETATRVSPVFIGKPNAHIMNPAVEKLGLQKNEVAMIGDNYETDIQAGIKNEIDTILVLTGFTKKSEVPHLPVAPTHVINNLDEWRI